MATHLRGACNETLVYDCEAVSPVVFARGEAKKQSGRIRVLQGAYYQKTCA
jgi:hypothetical protein